MRPEELKQNVTVYGPFFPEPVQIIIAVPMGSSVKLIGKGVRSSTARFRVQLVESRLQFSECLIGHGTKRAQGVVVGYSLLWAYVAEHIQLLLVFSTHAFFLSGCAVETREFRGTPSPSKRVFPQPARTH